MSQKITVVLSQAQGKHPAKRALEESILAALIMEPGLDVSVVPFLYDLSADHTGRLYLESVHGDMVLLSWLYPRGAFWVLDRDGIKGTWGETQIQNDADDDEDESKEPEEPKGIGAVDVPDRYIYCLDLRSTNKVDAYIEEVRRIAAECRERRLSSNGAPPAMVELGLPVVKANGNGQANGNQNGTFSTEKMLEAPGRRWYPVIDYSRCTNCLECLDFCLFGVYDVDELDRIKVESQDSCKRGCPACSRVCPEQAIIFPNYKTPAIAGAPVGDVGGLKIDLTKLFGGDLKDALAQAVEERDRELVSDGRDAVGMTVGLPKRQENKTEQPKDELDDLMDALDDLEL